MLKKSKLRFLQFSLDRNGFVLNIVPAKAKWHYVSEIRFHWYLVRPSTRSFIALKIPFTGDILVTLFTFITHRQAHREEDPWLAEVRGALAD